MNRFFALSVPALLVLSLAQGQTKKRVAVLDFEYGTVRNSAASVFGTDRDIGKGVADMIIDRLVKGGVYSVIERTHLDKILGEQNFSNSDRADASSAAKIGRLLGVDAIIIGSITQFGRDDSSIGVAGGALGGFGRKYGLGGVQKKDSKAAVGLTARVVNTDTAEILISAQGKGESNRSGASLLGAGGGSGTAAGAGIDMTSSNFGSTLIGEATNTAVTALAGQLQQQSGAIQGKKVTINAQVADVAGDVLILNAGTKGGIKVGDKLEVRRKIREVRDPASGKVIRSIVDKMGEVVITEADEQSSVGKFTGATPPKVGDQVQTP